MFRSQTDHHQGDTIFLLTSVTKFNTISYPERHSNNKTRQDLTHTFQQACCYINILNLVTEVKRNIVSP
jgi:hypothetical protein